MAFEVLHCTLPFTAIVRKVECLHETRYDRAARREQEGRYWIWVSACVIHSDLAIIEARKKVPGVNNISVVQANRMPPCNHYRWYWRSCDPKPPYALRHKRHQVAQYRVGDKT